MRFKLGWLVFLLVCLVGTANAAARPSLNLKLVCTQKDGHGKNQAQNTYVLSPRPGYSYSVRVSPTLTIRVLAAAGSGGVLNLTYYVVHGGETFGPSSAQLSEDSAPVQATFYLGQNTLQVELSPSVAVAVVPTVVKPAVGSKPHTEVCPTCDGSGKCDECGGTGKISCKACKGTAACQICGGSGHCPYCGDDGIVNGIPCVHCNGTHDCAVCSGSGACVGCSGKGYTRLCDACEGSGVCETCGGTGKVGAVAAPAHKK